MSANDFAVLVRIISVDGKSVEVDISHRVTSFTFEDDEKKSDKLKLQVENFDLANLDSPVIKTGAKLNVTWGYPGNLAPVRTMTITCVKGSTTLNVEAGDDSTNMNKVQKIREFEGLTRSEVAVLIAQEHGYSLGEIFVEDTLIKQEQVTQARMTDAQLIYDMAQREGYEWWIDYEGFHFKPRDLAQAPRKRFLYYTGGNVIRFNIENDIYSAGKTGGVVSKVVDPKTKKVSTAVADNVNTKRDGLAPAAGLVPGVDKKGSNKDSILNLAINNRTGKSTASTVNREASSGSAVVPTTAKNAEEAKKQADATFKKAAMQALKIVLDCVGDPTMVAKCVVTVDGIGVTHSGAYYVNSVTHKGTGGGDYTMTVKASRDGKNTAQGGGKPGDPKLPDASIPSKATKNDKAPTPEDKLVLQVKPDARTGVGVATYGKPK